MWDDYPLQNQIFGVNKNIFNLFSFSVDLDVVVAQDQYLDMKEAFLVAWLGSAPLFYPSGIYVVPKNTLAYSDLTWPGTAALQQQLMTTRAANGVRLNDYYQAAAEYNPAGVYTVKSRGRFIVPFGYKVQAQIFMSFANSAQAGYNAQLNVLGSLLTCG